MKLLDVLERISELKLRLEAEREQGLDTRKTEEEIARLERIATLMMEGVSYYRALKIVERQKIEQMKQEYKREMREIMKREVRRQSKSSSTGRHTRRR